MHDSFTLSPGVTVIFSGLIIISGTTEISVLSSSLSSCSATVSCVVVSSTQTASLTGSLVGSTVTVTVASTVPKELVASMVYAPASSTVASLISNVFKSLSKSQEMMNRLFFFFGLISLPSFFHVIFGSGFPVKRHFFYTMIDEQIIRFNIPCTNFKFMTNFVSLSILNDTKKSRQVCIYHQIALINV